MAPISRIRSRQSTANLVRLLKTHLAAGISPDGPPRLEALAREARCSARTVQRRLRGAGLTFMGLLDETRLEAAARLLREPRVRVVDVAVDLGYSDHANFTRAFRRWAGVSPTQYRGMSADEANRLPTERGHSR